MPFNPTQHGSLMSYYCQHEGCGEHINALDNSTYVKIVVCNANPGTVEIDMAGKSKLLGEIMTQPVPHRYYCMDCFHAVFGPAFELIPSGSV